MKGIQLISLCLIFSMYHCQDDDKATMIYAVGKKVFRKELSGSENSNSGSFESYDGAVTGLGIYDGFFFLTHAHVNPGQGPLKTSKIWRIKISPDSKSFSLSGSEWELFNQFSKDDEEDITSMAVAAGHVYYGSSKGYLRSCWADRASCRNFFLTDKKAWPSNASIGDVEYNTGNHEIYVVSSSNGTDQLWHCSTGMVPACSEVNIALKGRVRLHNAFDAFWIADAGLIRKCPYKEDNRNSRLVNNDNCLVFHNFTQPGYVNIGSSTKYLYARWDTTDNYIWRCDPNTLNSCSKAFELKHDGVVGTFTFY